MMQVAAVAGIWGITFLIAWGASTAEFAWARAFQWSLIRGPVLCYAAVLAVAVLGGSLRVWLAPTDAGAVRAATLNRPIDLFAPGEITRIAEDRLRDGERGTIDAKLARLHEWFLEGTRREARAGARLVAWPEQSLLVFSDGESSFIERARRVAGEERVSIAMGMAVIHHGDALPFENKLVLIDQSGAIVMSHLKTRPVAGWEEGIMKRGRVPVTVAATAEGRVAGAVCFEADFPEIMREAGRQRADLAVVVVNEWPEIKEVHFQMHAFRAIENGMAILRPAAAGLSAAIDPWGRIVGLSDFFAAGDRTMVAQVPARHVATLYARTGDLFAWLCVAGLTIALAAAARAALV
jgi:apolipoprotein N-acyltransferase